MPTKEKQFIRNAISILKFELYSKENFDEGFKLELKNRLKNGIEQALDIATVYTTLDKSEIEVNILEESGSTKFTIYILLAIEFIGNYGDFRQGLDTLYDDASIASKYIYERLFDEKELANRGFQLSKRLSDLEKIKEIKDRLEYYKSTFDVTETVDKEIYLRNLFKDSKELYANLEISNKDLFLKILPNELCTGLKKNLKDINYKRLSEQIVKDNGGNVVD